MEKITAQANSYTLKARGKLPSTTRPTNLKASLSREQALRLQVKARLQTTQQPLV